MRIAESRPLTQEIVQDVFLKIWINRASLSNIESFKAYLFVVARNHAFNCLKQLARERNRKKEWINSVLQDASYSSDDTAEMDAGALVDEAVDLLPPQQKKVYTLSRREGLKQEEIARELNVSLETVKKHMVLALRFIRNYLRSHIGILIFLIAGFLKR